MPIYEYQCDKCRRVFNFLVRNPKDHKSPACPKCGHEKMSRLMSRFASIGREGKAGETGDIPGLEGLDEKDPRSMGRMMRKMAEETGEAMPPELDEMCRRLESGEDPEKIEDEMGEPGSTESSDDKLYEA